MVEHAERMRDDQAYVLCCNHQSSGDILAMFALRKQFRWVSKRELFAVPFLGWMMAMAGYVGIKRGDKRSRERMMAKCRRQLELGNTIAIFPEGISHDEPRLQPLRRNRVDVSVAMPGNQRLGPVLRAAHEGPEEMLAVP